MGRRHGSVLLHRAVWGLTPLFLASATLIGQQPTQPAPVFKSGVNLVLVDVVVRDRSGAIVRGLTVDDFELLEDGARQPVLSFAFEDIKPGAAMVENATALAAASGARAVATLPPPTATAPPAAAPANDLPSHPLTSEEVAGHRLLTLVFDTSSMEPDDVQKAIDGALKWVDEQMTSADLVAVASINTSLQVLTDFTSSK
ncbi:MAG TPA: VWA domain-containing protein, partial [Vicinamibacterales bacterium]|nr:VWA domain-containing protein [Vicinamibacterales bacterium]